MCFRLPGRAHRGSITSPAIRPRGRTCFAGSKVRLGCRPTSASAARIIGVPKTATCGTSARRAAPSRHRRCLANRHAVALSTARHDRRPSAVHETPRPPHRGPNAPMTARHGWGQVGSRALDGADPSAPRSPATRESPVPKRGNQQEADQAPDQRRISTSAAPVPAAHRAFADPPRRLWAAVPVGPWPGAHRPGGRAAAGPCLGRSPFRRQPFTASHRANRSGESNPGALHRESIVELRPRRDEERRANHRTQPLGLHYLRDVH